MHLPVNYIKLAKEAAKLSNLKNQKVGACIIGNGIYVGANRKKSHPISMKLYGKAYSIHAEVDAIRSAGRDSDRSVLIVYREDSEGNIRNARPCSGCFSHIVANNIHKVYYSIDNETFGLIQIGLNQREKHIQKIGIKSMLN